MWRRSLLLIGLLPLFACAVQFDPPPSGRRPNSGAGSPGQGGHAPITGQGPGKREQTLALTPAEELKIGEEAFEDTLTENRNKIVPKDHPYSRKVREIGGKIQEAAAIPSLRKEINLRVDDRYLKWEYVVIDNKQANAFCLPGGKVAVYTGLMEVTQGNDAMLATVIAHEVAHALAHHSSERLARRKAQGGRGSLADLHYEREQESEADHIGIFLMTFAGYDPSEAERFWQRMQERGGGGMQMPEIFSDHPSDARRIAQIHKWRNHAVAGLAAYKAGRIAQ